MFQPFRLLFLLLLACPPQASAQEAGAPPASIEVIARRNPGDLPYRFFLRGQQRLASYLPPEPRLLDVMLRVSFTELPLPQQDEYAPNGRAVSIVGDTVDHALAVRRGGYFVLPELAAAYEEDATIMFKEQSRSQSVDVAWVVRVGREQRLAYDDALQVMRELRSVQQTISIFDLSLRTEKYGKYDALKACFLDSTGELLVDEKPAADAVIGNCLFLKLDSSQRHQAKVIEFRGPLDIVTVVESRLFHSYFSAIPRDVPLYFDPYSRIFSYQRPYCIRPGAQCATQAYQG